MALIPLMDKDLKEVFPFGVKDIPRFTTKEFLRLVEDMELELSFLVAELVLNVDIELKFSF